MLHHGLAKGVAQLAAKGLQNGWDVILYWVAHCHVVEGLDDLQQKLATWKRRSIQDTALLAVPAVLGYIGSPSLLNLAAGAVSLLQAALGAHRHHQDVIRHLGSSCVPETLSI